MIYQIQGPEAHTPLTATLPRNQNTTNNPPPSGLPNSVPTVAPAHNLVPAAQQPTTVIQADNSPPTSFLAFFIHHIRTDPQARMCKDLTTVVQLCLTNLPGLTLIIFLTLIVRVIMSPLLSLIFVASTYCSIWAPQIVRSVRRGRSSGLSKSYILGTTTCRLLSAICESCFFWCVSCSSHFIQIFLVVRAMFWRWSHGVSNCESSAITKY